jgi:hypothetical protein
MYTIILTWMPIYDSATLLGQLILDGWDIKAIEGPTSKDDAAGTLAFSMSGLKFDKTPVDKQADTCLTYLKGKLGNLHYKYYSLTVLYSGYVSIGKCTVQLKQHIEEVKK